ncbi:MAG: hypothetical protein M1825_004922 [Sarcosagium campestre]|nr:MAG: hypothetical protein M1825_004922 [Sarcosagium campestre]
MSAASYFGSAASTPMKPESGYDHVPSQYTEDQVEKLRSHDEKLKRNIRLLRILSRFATAVLSAVIVGIMAATVSKYLSTKDILVEVDGKPRGPWANGTKMWPTIMLFVISGISLILNLFILVAYYFSFQAANRTAIVSSIFTFVVFVGHVVVWIVVTGLYKYAKDHKDNGKHLDLWGWACSTAADAIQDDFKDVVNFKKSCNIQGSSWGMSIAEVVVEVFSLSIYIFVIRRMKTKQKMELARKSIPAQAM